MLSLEIGELGEAGFDLSLTGFDGFELGELFAERTQGRTDPNDAPEPPAFQELGTKQYAANSQDDRKALTDHRGWHRNGFDVEREAVRGSPHCPIPDVGAGASRIRRQQPRLLKVWLS